MITTVKCISCETKKNLNMQSNKWLKINVVEKNTNICPWSKNIKLHIKMQKWKNDI